MAVKKLTLELAAGVAGLKQDLASAGTLVSGFAARAKQALGGIGSAIKDGLADVITGSDPLKLVTTAVKDLAGSIPLVGGAITGAVGIYDGFIDKVKSMFDPILAVRKEAGNLGISVTEMSRLVAGIGGDADAASKPLAKLQRTIAEARMGSKEAAGALGLLGLSAEDLGAMPLSQALGVVVDRINATGDAADRANLKFQIFGKGAGALGGVFAGGSAGLNAKADLAQAQGRTFTDADAGGVAAAKKEMARWKDEFEGLWTQIAVKVAPLIGGLFKAFSDERGKVNVQQIAEYAESAMESVIRVGGVLKGSFNVVANVVETIAGGIAQIYTWALKLAGNFEAAVKVEADMKAAGARIFGRSGLTESIKEADELIARIKAGRTGVLALGATAITPEDLDRARELASLTQRANSLMAGVETPYERFAKGATEVNELFEAGVLSMEEMYRLSNKIVTDFEKASLEAKDLYKPVGAVSAGSAAAFSAQQYTASWMKANQDAGNTPLERLNRAFERGQKLAEQQAADGKERVRLLRIIVQQNGQRVDFPPP